MKKAIAYSSVEGAIWEIYPPDYAPSAHAVMYDDGTIWDELNGNRPTSVHTENAFKWVNENLLKV